MVRSPESLQLIYFLKLYYIIIMSLKDFQIISELGQGAYSTVFRVKRLIDNKDYAMKKVKMDNLSQKQKQNALNEVRVLASIQHPNIISFQQAFFEKGSNFLYIIMEYADDGDLLAKIKRHNKAQTTMPESQTWSIFIQVTHGLKVLHDLKILHRDIKSANVFLNKNGLVKLGDLNVSKLVKSFCQTQTGTPYYASPQIWKNQSYDKKSDIWSLGCVLYQMIALKPPFRANDMEGLHKKVIRGFYSRLPPEYSIDLSIVLKMLLQVTPHLRSSCEKLLEHPIIQKYMIELPNELLNRSTGHAQLMKTILINRRQNLDELSKKVELPKSRYFSTIDAIIPSNRSKKPLIDQQKSLILPKINSKHQEEQSLVMESLNKSLRKLGSKKRIQNTKKQGISNLQGVDAPRRSRLENYSLSSNIEEENSQKYARIKRISPDIIEKILRNERERQKVHSIIGTK